MAVARGSSTSFETSLDRGGRAGSGQRAGAGAAGRLVSTGARSIRGGCSAWHGGVRRRDGVFGGRGVFGGTGALAWGRAFGCHEVMGQRLWREQRRKGWRQRPRCTTGGRALYGGPAHDLGPDGVGRQHEHPTRVYPVVVHQRTPVRL